MIKFKLNNLEKIKLYEVKEFKIEEVRAVIERVDFYYLNDLKTIESVLMFLNKNYQNQNANDAIHIQYRLVFISQYKEYLKSNKELDTNFINYLLKEFNEFSKLFTIDNNLSCNNLLSTIDSLKQVQDKLNKTLQFFTSYKIDYKEVRFYSKLYDANLTISTSLQIKEYLYKFFETKDYQFFELNVKNYFNKDALPSYNPSLKEFLQDNNFIIKNQKQLINKLVVPFIERNKSYLCKNIDLIKLIKKVKLHHESNSFALYKDSINLLGVNNLLKINNAVIKELIQLKFIDFDKTHFHVINLNNSKYDNMYLNEIDTHIIQDLFICILLTTTINEYNTARSDTKEEYKLITLKYDVDYITSQVEETVKLIDVVAVEVIEDKTQNDIIDVATLKVKKEVNLSSTSKKKETTKNKNDFLIIINYQDYKKLSHELINQLHLLATFHKLNKYWYKNNGVSWSQFLQLKSAIYKVLNKQ